MGVYEMTMLPLPNTIQSQRHAILEIWDDVNNNIVIMLLGQGVDSMELKITAKPPNTTALGTDKNQLAGVTTITIWDLKQWWQ